MNQAAPKALLDPANRQRLEQRDLPPIMGGSPEQVAAFLRSEVATCVPMVRASGATAD